MKDYFAAFGDWLKQGLSLLGDLIILNLLFILCSIPIITIGAAGAASYSCIIRILKGERVGMTVSIYFRDFRANFKKATLGWLIELVCLLILAGDLWFAVIYSQPNNVFFLIFAIVLGAALFLAGVWFYPLVARFENKLGVHIKNAFLMVLANFPKTFLALLVQAAFILIPFLLFDVFISIGWFWLLFGASLPMYLTAKILRRTLQCEKKNTTAQQPEES